MSQRPYKLKLTRTIDGSEKVKSFKTIEAREREMERIRRSNLSGYSITFHTWETERKNNPDPLDKCPEVGA